MDDMATWGFIALGVLFVASEVFVCWCFWPRREEIRRLEELRDERVVRFPMPPIAPKTEALLAKYKRPV